MVSWLPEGTVIGAKSSAPLQLWCLALLITQLLSWLSWPSPAHPLHHHLSISVNMRKFVAWAGQGEDWMISFTGLSHPWKLCLRSWKM